MKLPNSGDDWSNLSPWEQVAWALEAVALPKARALADNPHPDDARVDQAEVWLTLFRALQASGLNVSLGDRERLETAMERGYADKIRVIVSLTDPWPMPGNPIG
ncbi:MAG: hypothetical protein ACREMN_09170 [Gemmatimonadales bacterium]